jgi:Activator of Hsp90 ATPase homolog 1-like protein
MTNTQLKLPPVVKSIVVARGADDAFEIYTRDIGKWWPTGTHSIGRAEVANVLIEPRIGGRIFERWKDGTEKLWGTISVWEKGQRLVHSWHVSTDPDHASEVEVQFAALGGNRTRVTLEHRNWERMSGEQAQETRNSYDNGWNGVFIERFGNFTGKVDT